MRTAFINGKLVLPDAILTGRNLLINTGVIEEITSEVPDDANVINAAGLYIAPGFIDLHVHGGMQADFMDGTEEAFRTAAQNSLSGGATTIYPTTVCASDETLQTTFRVFRKVKNDPGLPHMPGLHLEGPYLASEQAGAQNPDFLKMPVPQHWQMILDNHDIIARVTAACELPGALELGDLLRRNGIVASIGHSDADYSDVVEAVAHGYTHVTHLYSGMSALHRKNAYRILGLVESAFLLDELTVEIIADGRHLPPELLRLILKCKDHTSISLVTDALRGSGLPEGSVIALGGSDKRNAVIENGVAIMEDRCCFCGSVATAAMCVRTMWKDAGIPLHEAVQMMTGNPARVMGIDRFTGSLKPGLASDLVLFDKDVSVRQVHINNQSIVI